VKNRAIETELVPFGEPGVTREVLIIALLEGLSEPSDRLQAVDSVAGGIISSALSSGDFVGRAEQTLTLRSTKQTGPKRIILTGLGRAEELDDERVRRALAAAYKVADTFEAADASVDIGSLAVAGPDVVRSAELIAETAHLTLWRSLAYRTELKDEEKPRLSRVSLLWPEEQIPTAAVEAARVAATTAAGTCYARELVSRPANDLYPETLAEEAEQIAARHGFSIEIFDEHKLSELGMNALLSVGRGSVRPPRLIFIDSAAGSEDKPLALVGKGLTFDSGGISIKPSKGMEEMKGDMAGAAAVLATADVLGRIGYDRRFVVAVPAAENMPGASAQRPGDIWKS